MKCTDTAWEASGTCRSSGGCEVSGKIGGKIDFLRKSGTNVQTLLERALTGTTTLDAAGIAIDISQSTVQVPATGQLTINLVDSSTGQTQASRVFSWTRTGLKLVLSDPNAVNTWAMQSGGTADSLQYKLHTFAVSESSGWNTLAQEVTYEGEPQAYATTTWRGQICPNDPLRREDRRHWQTSARWLALLDCTNATPDQISHAGRTLDGALNSAEELLGQRIHVSEARYVLVRPEEGFLYRSSQILKRRKLKFRIAIRFDPSNPHKYEIDAVRSTAHELYHMASLFRHSGAKARLREEKAASIFETCVERKVFKNVRATAFDEKLQSTVGNGHGLRSIDQSDEGNRQATIVLGRIAGPDFSLSSDEEHAALDDLCRSLAFGPT